MPVKIGLIVNPIAGVGGSVGLKGSDGADVVKQALEMGAKPRSEERAETALTELKPYQDEFVVVTGPGALGERVVASVGLAAQVLACGHKDFGQTDAQDTINLAKLMKEQGVQVILFAGGDGTARDVFKAVGDDQPVIGIPAGVKIHSAVYSTDPRNAGRLAADVILGRTAGWEQGEVMDIDEDQFRKGIVAAKLFGYMQIPYARQLLQGSKVSSGGGNRAQLGGMAAGVAEDMEEDCLYIMGPGSTTAAIMDHLELANTLLGIDAVINKQLVGSDLTEKQLLQLLDIYPKRKIIVTPIGGQGFLFGRGNQQISPRVVTQVGRENIIVVASRHKMDSFYGKKMLVDTGDENVNEMLRGHIRVVVAYKRETVAIIG